MIIHQVDIVSDFFTFVLRGSFNWDDNALSLIFSIFIGDGFLLAYPSSFKSGKIISKCLLLEVEYFGTLFQLFCLRWVLHICRVPSLKLTNISWVESFATPSLLTKQTQYLKLVSQHWTALSSSSLESWDNVERQLSMYPEPSWSIVASGIKFPYHGSSIDYQVS